VDDVVRAIRVRGGAAESFLGDLSDEVDAQTCVALAAHALEHALERTTHDVSVPGSDLCSGQPFFEFFGTKLRPESYRDKEQVTFNQ
jgi:hypothetical protein